MRSNHDLVLFRIWREGQLATFILLGLLCPCLEACDSERSDFSVDDTELEYGQTDMKPSSIDLDRGLSLMIDTALDLEQGGGFDVPPDQDLSEGSLTEEGGLGIFRLGCPRSGFAHARQMNGSGKLKGVAALAERGDFLLMNHHTAFVIQDPTRLSRTWWYYGGQVIDAVPLSESCELADIDRLDSLGMVLIEGEITDFDQASVRAFQGERAQVISDGSGGGEARVRVYGRDAPMWLVEFELLRRLLSGHALDRQTVPLICTCLGW